MPIKKKPATKSGKKSSQKKQSKKTSANNLVVETTRSKTARKARHGFPIIGVGASAGGLEAFESFFKAMPIDSGMAFVVVAHLDPSHVSILPELLQKSTRMKVNQVKDGHKVAPNQIYVIPPNHNMSILRGVLQLMDLPSPRTSNLPIDNFFRDLAKDQGANAGCIIMSGTGSDGTLGVRAIKGEIGLVMVQSEESAKYDGMPRSAIATGMADYVLAPEKMPEQLVKYQQHAAGEVVPRVAPDMGKVPDALQKIFIVLRARTNHDFSQYKMNTICRRIERRMNVHQIDNIEGYVRHLQASDQESEILFKELLIGVTNFFRDPEAFDALAKKVIPGLFLEKPEDYTIRVWVPGCSSGEEAYSIAMLLHEHMEKEKCHVNVQIFGTDIDEDAIAQARAGVYPESIHADVSQTRLKRYFSKEEGGTFRIKKIIREMLVFAPQNIIKDPPFTKLDLLCCRNLLIYFSPEFQKKLLPIFHYSLKPDGFLFLGTSESVGQEVNFFKPVDKKWKIFERQISAADINPPINFQVDVKPNVADFADPSEHVRRVEELSALQLAETILQQSDAPPCVIIDRDNNVVYIHGRTGQFLEPAEGKISVNVVGMARQGLGTELNSAITRARMHKQKVVHTGITIKTNGDQIFINLTVSPILGEAQVQGLLLVSFERASQTGKPKSKPKRSPIGNARRKSAAELEQEVQFTRETLQTTIEELETSNEELKSTNEELQSTNEELQSTNEEMETSKEELQSLNEESATVNTELQGRIDELSKTHDDMKNLLDCTGIATLFLDTDMQVRRFTPKCRSIIPLEGSDIGRPIGHFSSVLRDVDLEKYGNEVLTDLRPLENRVESYETSIYLMRIQPYRTVANVIDGVVITFEDITEQERAQRATMKERYRAQRCIDVVDSIVVALDSDGKISMMNRMGCELIGYGVDEIIGMDWFETVVPASLRADAVASFRRILAGETEPDEFFESPILDKGNSEHLVAWHNVLIKYESGNIEGTLRSGRIIEG